MNDDREQSNDVVCPEWGGAVRVLIDTLSAWSHRARMIPSLAWVVVVLVLLVLISPWGQGRFGNRFAYWEKTESSRVSRIQYSEQMVSLDRLIAADGGDLSGRDELVV